MSKKINAIGNLAVCYSNRPIFRSLLQLLPNWGVANELLQQRAHEIKTERLRTFFDELAEGQHELNDELVQSEDFLHSYFCTVRAVLNTRQREKIKLFARLLDTSLSPDMRITSDEYEELLNILESISLREFAVLFDLWNVEQQHPKSDKQNDLQNTLQYWRDFKNSCVTKYEIPEGSFTAFMARIERTGLYLRITAPLTNYNGDAGRTTPVFSRLLQVVKTES